MNKTTLVTSGLSSPANLDFTKSAKPVFIDPVSPSYYKGRDVMDIINRYNLSFCLGNVVKYILRSKEKGGRIDLEKALWYLKEEISNENKA